MALPKWITPEGNLGIVPELEYYEFLLDAYDASAGTLEYSLVSGKLPLGIQVIRTGKLQGIPVSEQGGDQNVKYTFTIRATNTTTDYVTDRTFNLTITNVAPPLISFPTRNSNLGLYTDGSEINIQCLAIEATPGATLTWTLKSGELPTGLTLSSSGVLSGYLQPIASNVPGEDPGWDDTAWNTFGWDFTASPVSKTFLFTIEVSDGINTDQSSYRLLVFPKNSITADDNILTADASTAAAGIPLTADLGTKHNPIITTAKETLVPVRQGTFLSFNIDAIDLDSDIVNYSIPSVASGAFDEQDFSIIASLPYVGRLVANTSLDTGGYPLTSYTVSTIDNTVSTSSTDITRAGLEPGDIVKVLKTTTVDGLPYDLWYQATVNNNITLRLAGNVRVTANVGDSVTQAITGANATISSITSTTGYIHAGGSVLTGYITTSGSQPTYDITLSGNVRANVGQFITQPISGANATVLANSITYMYLSGSITASVGSYITQPSTGANARVSMAVDGSVAFVYYLSGTFNLTANVRVNNVWQSPNVYPTLTTVNSNVVSVIYTVGKFTESATANLRLNGSYFSSNVRPIANVKIPNTVTIHGNIGETIVQSTTGAVATITGNVRDAIVFPVTFDSGTFSTGFGSGNLTVAGISEIIYPDSVVTTPVLQTFRANVGEYITQTSTGANAQVTANVINSLRVPVTFLGNNFTIGSSNLRVNGSNVKIYPLDVVCNTDISATYISASTFNLNVTDASAIIRINGVTTNSYISSVPALGVTIGSQAVEGTSGFDEVKYDQGTLDLPQGLSINTTTGWITGLLPPQSIPEQQYQFEVIAYKRDDTSYSDTQLYTLTVLGDLNNKITWLTDSDLGTIQNGKVSDLYVKAVSSKGKLLVYTLSPSKYQNLPQGLKLTSSGNLSGRVSFELFNLDQGTTTIDPDSNGASTTTFDNTFVFNVWVNDVEYSVSESKEFTVRVINANIKPYENLYLKALPNEEQRKTFRSILQDKVLFPPELIYRNDDPYFGLATDIKSLFLPGINPSEADDYVIAARTNHSTKRIVFGDIKTAQALDSNFNVKYEVIYLEIKDHNTNALGQGPSKIQFPLIDNPYYDFSGNAYTVAYPNSFGNMEDTIIDALGYANKGALPDWMTSKQVNGKVLGFVNAVVLAYVNPGYSEKISYRLTQRNINFNEIDFTLDRYQLDNVYTTNYDILANAFITSSETTFDRYPSLGSVFTSVGYVNYAVSLPFDSINQHTVEDIQNNGGFDGITDFQDGDTLIFAQQEFRLDQGDIVEYNQGWSNIQTLWGGSNWDYDADTTDNPYTDVNGYVVIPWSANLQLNAGQVVSYLGNVYIAMENFTTNVAGIFSTTITSGTTTTTVLVQDSIRSGPNTTTSLGWDKGDYIPGSREVGITSAVNQRIGIWEVNIDANQFVTLTFKQAIVIYDKLYITNGRTYGGTNVYYDPVVKSGLTIPNYSVIPQQIKTVTTEFDGNGTRFFSNRDQYAIPEAGDKYIKFTKTGVFT